MVDHSGCGGGGGKEETFSQGNRRCAVGDGGGGDGGEVNSLAGDHSGGGGGGGKKKEESLGSWRGAVGVGGGGYGGEIDWRMVGGSGRSGGGKEAHVSQGIRRCEVKGGGGYGGVIGTSDVGDSGCGGGGSDEVYEYVSADSDFEGFSLTMKVEKKDRIKKALVPGTSFPRLDVADSQGVKVVSSSSDTQDQKSGNSTFEHKKGSGGEDLRGSEA